MKKEHGKVGKKRYWLEIMIVVISIYVLCRLAMLFEHYAGGNY